MYAEFVERFKAAWAASDVTQHYAVWRDDVELHQPVLGSLYGRAACLDAFTRLFTMAPDLTLDVHDWHERQGLLAIHFTFRTSFGGGLRWPAVDLFRLDGEGLTKRRDSFFDPLPVVAHMLRHPSTWPRAARAGLLVPRWPDPARPPIAAPAGPAPSTGVDPL